MERAKLAKAKKPSIQFDALERTSNIMESIEHYLAEARGIVDRAERESRGLTKSERERGERILGRVQDLRDNAKFTDKIARFNAEFSGHGGSSGGFGAAVIGAGFDAKSRPSVDIPLQSILTKAPVFPGSGDWSRADPKIVPLGQDQRFLHPHLLTTNIEGVSAIQDFKQSARTLTGTVKRALDATTDKASLDTTLTLVTENVAEFAVVIVDVPNAIFESVPLMRQFLDGEGAFQVQKALDGHVFAQIVAASPPFGTSGSDLIAKIRNGISTMRSTGANPTVVVLNPTDAASLDLSADAGGYVFATRDSGSGSPLWGLRVVERVGAGTEAPYLLDPATLGMLYLSAARFEVDPYTAFKKNLSTLRVEVRALFHVRNSDGARRVAAT